MKAEVASSFAAMTLEDPGAAKKEGLGGKIVKMVVTFAMLGGFAYLAYLAFAPGKEPIAAEEEKEKKKAEAVYATDGAKQHVHSHRVHRFTESAVVRSSLPLSLPCSRLPACLPARRPLGWLTGWPAGCLPTFSPATCFHAPRASRSPSLQSVSPRAVRGVNQFSVHAFCVVRRQHLTMPTACQAP